MRSTSRMLTTLAVTGVMVGGPLGGSALAAKKTTKYHAGQVCSITKKYPKKWKCVLATSGKHKGKYVLEPAKAKAKGK